MCSTKGEEELVIAWEEGAANHTLCCGSHLPLLPEEQSSAQASGRCLHFPKYIFPQELGWGY